MFKAIALASLSMIAVNSFAGVPSEVSKFLDKNGTFISLENGKEYSAEHGNNCAVRVNPNGRGSSILIEGYDYLKPQANFDGAVRSQGFNGSVTFELADNGKTSGFCRSTMLMKYKKSVEIQGNTLLIVTRSKCLGDFKTQETVQGCKISR